MTNPPSADAAGAPGPVERLAGMLSPQAIGSLLADAEAAGTAIDGPDGPLAKMTKAVLERALDVEIADHLGYERGVIRRATARATPATGTAARRCTPPPAGSSCRCRVTATAASTRSSCPSGSGASATSRT
jgi:hypothetical protein